MSKKSSSLTPFCSGEVVISKKLYDKLLTLRNQFDYVIEEWKGLIKEYEILKKVHIDNELKSLIDLKIQNAHFRLNEAKKAAQPDALLHEQDLIIEEAKLCQ